MSYLLMCDTMFGKNDAEKYQAFFGILAIISLFLVTSDYFFVNVFWIFFAAGIAMIIVEKYGEKTNTTPIEFNTAGVIGTIFIFILIISALSGYQQNTEESSYYNSYVETNQEIETFDYNKYSSILDSVNEIRDLSNDALLNYNTNEYSTVVSLTQELEQKNDLLKAELEDFNAYVQYEYKYSNLKKEDADYYLDQYFEFNGYSDDSHTFNTYLQKAAESAKMKDISEANRYVNLVDNSMRRMNEHMDKANLNTEYKK